MAGRGAVEAIDTVSSPRILTLNEKSELILAKEPLHFYEPKMKGTGNGLAFAKELLKNIPENISILLIPTAVGGSSISQWINNKTFRGVQLLSNFEEKVNLGAKYGAVKAILWHQGESDAKAKSIPVHKDRMKSLFSEFRKITGNNNLPILVGEIGYFGKSKEQMRLNKKMNKEIRKFVKSDKNTGLVKTKKLNHKGDMLHFDSESQRKLGKQYATLFLRKFY